MFYGSGGSEVSFFTILTLYILPVLFDYLIPFLILCYLKNISSKLSKIINLKEKTIYNNSKDI